MSGYTPVFGSVFKGSLCGKWPDSGIWLALLAMQDKNGEIDAHPSFIATVTGCPQEQVEACIARFCEPDPSSRTPDEDGRRLVPIVGRGFGWRVVNHRKYHEKARKAASDASRAADGRNAERMRTRADPRRPALTRSDPPSDSDANTDKRESERRRSSRAPKDFEPDREYALRVLPDLDVEAEVQAFRDWEFKTPRSDWSAVWRTWIKGCKDSGRYARSKKDPYAGAI